MKPIVPKGKKKELPPKVVSPKGIPVKLKGAAHHKTFPIVAIGASSGGLEAVTELLMNVPINTGMAFIVIQHLSPDFESMLTSLLSKATKMKVQTIEDMDLMVPNNVYVIPNDKEIEVIDGHIQLNTRQKSKRINLSIDVLFTSLAITHKEGAIGVVLSGNASDGTLGLKAIREQGGITFAQDDSAKFQSMPESAISEGVADFIMSPKEIALELARISQHASKSNKALKVGNENQIDDNDVNLKTIIELLYKANGVDFAGYKMNTIKRRILRRMFLYHIATLKEYVKLLKTTKTEIGVLYNDLLINVTEFFREPEAFQYLKTTAFPKLLKAKPANEMLRVWVTACSTGQEAYSIAMLLLEIIGDNQPEKKVQIFASDLSEQAIKKARTGEYSKHEVQGVSPKRLERFFTMFNGQYRITKQVRDLCSFAPHNILGDPPFSRIDFISCCNMLIYFDAPLQKKVLTTFQYALNDDGCLMLGKAETIGTSTLFAPANGNTKIYLRKKGARILPSLTPRMPIVVASKKGIPLQKKQIGFDAESINATINSMVFTRFIPAYVVINHAMEIVQFKGATSNYLEHSTGKATLNILSMARPEIAFELRDAINKAITTKKEITKEGLEITSDAVSQMVTVTVMPLETEGEELLLVVFKEDGVQIVSNATPGSEAQDNSIKKLRSELAAVRLELVLASEEKDKATMVLQAVNEEILSSNEEFQSMNEELHTSKEEIECTNEELITTNQELQMRNGQLAEAYDFSEAIVATLHEPMLILDKELCVKSCNKAFCKTFNVLQKDTEGKLLYELGNHQWDILALRVLLEDIIPKDKYFYDYEITNVFPDIGKRTMLLNARRIVQKVQDEQLILLAFTDCTETTRKRKEEKQQLEDVISERTKALEESFSLLKEKNVALIAMNNELETFTYISSHDLQEPLRKIKNFASVLLDEEHATLSDSGKQYLQRMQESVKRMHMLIEDLLIYSRTKDGKAKFEKTSVNKIAAEVVEDFKELIADKKALVKIEGLSQVKMVRFQFKQLLQNLVGNALKFADSSRYPRILIKSEILLGSKLGNKSLDANKQYCHIIVSDNGIGFDPKFDTRIFEVFQRLNEYDDYKGTGMGLAICKRIAENHNGIICANGVLGKSARFDIYIPA